MKKDFHNKLGPDFVRLNPMDLSSTAILTTLSLPLIDNDVNNFRMLFEKCYEDALEAPSSFT